MDSYNWRSYAKRVLRRASYKTPMYNEAKKAARIERGVYKCSECERQGIEPDKNRHGVKEINVDHIVPIANLELVDKSLDTFAERLFCEPENLQILCKPHHKEKSEKERAERKILKEKLKNET